MAKDRSFSAKIASTHNAVQRRCPVCGEIQNNLKVVQTAKNVEKNSWRFIEKSIAICKCNDKEVFG
jgi:hypothetical protein